MFFGRRGPLLYARIGILAVFLLVVFVFHAHGETLRVLQGVRLALIVALIVSAVVLRRRRS